MKLTATELGAKRFDTQKAFKHAKTQQQMQEACKSKTKTSNPSLIQSLLAPTDQMFNNNSGCQKS